MENNLKILAIGLDDYSYNLLCEYWPQKNIVQIDKMDLVFELIENPESLSFCAAFCGNSEDFDAHDLVKAYKTQFSDTPIFFIAKKSYRYRLLNLRESGYTDVFLGNFEEGLLMRVFNKIAFSSSASSRTNYAPIRLIDIDANAKLNFKIWLFLPRNNKHVLLCEAGETFTQNRIDSLIKKNVHSIEILREDLPLFYEYTANKLLNFSKSEFNSETEKKIRLENSIRELFNSIFDNTTMRTPKTGLEMRDHCYKIISKYIKNSSNTSIFDRIYNSISDGDTPYAHSLSTSTFATLLSIGTGIGNPEDLAIAGLLHDVGLVEIPLELRNKPKNLWTFEEKKLYKQHPQASLKFILNKRIPINERVSKAILEHHERCDKKGYPNKLSEKFISDEAQLLSFADEFDYLTRTKEGVQPLSIEQAFATILKYGSYKKHIIQKLAPLMLSNNKELKAS